MTFLFGRRGTGVLSATGRIRRGESVGQAGVSPAVYSSPGKMPVGPTVRMAVLLSL
jgi:hypothetical protein